MPIRARRQLLVLPYVTARARIIRAAVVSAAAFLFTDDVCAMLLVNACVRGSISILLCGFCASIASPASRVRRLRQLPCNNYSYSSNNASLSPRVSPPCCSFCTMLGAWLYYFDVAVSHCRCLLVVVAFISRRARSSSYYARHLGRRQ